MKSLFDRLLLRVCDGGCYSIFRVRKKLFRETAMELRYRLD